MRSGCRPLSRPLSCACSAGAFEHLPVKAVGQARLREHHAGAGRSCGSPKVKGRVRKHVLLPLPCEHVGMFARFHGREILLEGTARAFAAHLKTSRLPLSCQDADGREFETTSKRKALGCLPLHLAARSCCPSTWSPGRCRSSAIPRTWRGPGLAESSLAGGRRAGLAPSTTGSQGDPCSRCAAWQHLGGSQR